MAKLRVNGQAIEFAMDPGTPLLWALRDAANLTGAKQGCGGLGQCGACTVIIDGVAAQSCTVPIGSLEGADVTSVEGLANHPLTQALVTEEAVQCGFCLPGFVCAAAALLQQSPRPTREQVEALPIQCPCGAQSRLLRAVERLAGSFGAAAAPPPPATTPEIVPPR